MATTPAPLVLNASDTWLGNDGNWSTFTIGVGTPVQTFNVIPALVVGEVWVPVPDGCDWISSAVSCAASRGVDDAQSLGFQTANSSTWDPVGIYQLATEQGLFSSTENGLYGLDNVTLGDVNYAKQTVAGIATTDFWLGSLGLGTKNAQFTVESSSISSLLASAKAQNTTPSLSYGYAAGAYYHSSPGNLVLGGYDRSRFSGENVTIDVGNSASNETSLGVSVRSFLVSNSLLSTFSMPDLTKNLSLKLDSTLSQLWLPQSICDKLSEAFGLIYESSTGLYLVNSTIHDRLVNLNPSITLTIAANATSSSTTDIVIPYAAFDQNLGIPFYNGSQPYFPIRVAANGSQHVLGRPFLQEAYLVVDWERGNFTVGQANHAATAPDIVPILPPRSGPGNDSLSSGAVAGIAIGVVAVVLALGLIAFFVWRKKRSRKTTRTEEDEKDPLAEDVSAADTEGKQRPNTLQELHSDHKVGAEIMSDEIHELQDAHLKPLLMSTPVYELAGDPIGAELHDPATKFEQKKPSELDDPQTTFGATQPAELDDPSSVVDNRR